MCTAVGQIAGFLENSFYDTKTQEAEFLRIAWEELFGVQEQAGKISST